MAWNAKPKGAYAIGSDEWKENLDEIYRQLGYTWTIYAIAGMGGNLQSESGLNPWRWQSDIVSLTDDKKGYGLPQFTPAYGYINDYGRSIPGFAPNLSVTEITEGANPSDGYAQIVCIDEDRAGKFINRTRYCDYADISAYYPMSNFKKGTDLWLATVAWLYHYEFPAKQYRTYEAAQARYASSLKFFEYLNTGEHPEPEPDPDPPGPSPQPRDSETALKIWMYPHLSRIRRGGT